MSPGLNSMKLNPMFKHKDKGTLNKTKHYSSGIFSSPSTTSHQIKADSLLQNLNCKGIFCKLKEGHSSINK